MEDNRREYFPVKKVHCSVPVQAQIGFRHEQTIVILRSSTVKIRGPLTTYLYSQLLFHTVQLWTANYPNDPRDWTDSVMLTAGDPAGIWAAEERNCE